MKIYKTVTIPATEAKTVEKVDSVVCDICKKVGKEDNVDGNKWGFSNSDILNTRIEFSKGCSNYHDGGERTTIYFDIYNDCFLNKLKPYLESLGANSYENYSDW